MSIWVAGWIAVGLAIGLSIVVFDPGSKQMTNGDVVKLAIFSLSLWPLVVLVYIYVRLEEGWFGDWLDRPFFKSNE